MVAVELDVTFTRAIFAHAIKSGAETVYLETTLKQKAATSLYEAMGYSYIPAYQVMAHDEQVFMKKDLY